MLQALRWRVSCKAVDRVGGPQVRRCCCVPGDPEVAVKVVVLPGEAGAKLAGHGDEVGGELGVLDRGDDPGGVKREWMSMSTYSW